MSKHNEYSLGDAIKQMVKSYKLEDKLSETSLINNWEKVMGTVVAKRTTNLYIHNKKLFVTLSSAPLREELIMARDTVLQRLNEEAGGEVLTEIIFR